MHIQLEFAPLCSIQCGHLHINLHKIHNTWGEEAMHELSHLAGLFAKQFITLCTMTYTHHNACRGTYKDNAGKYANYFLPVLAINVFVCTTACTLAGHRSSCLYVMVHRVLGLCCT